MVGGPNDPRSCLAGLQPVKRDVDEEKRNGWNQLGILVVSKDDDRLGWAEKEMVKQLGEKLYGSRQRKEACHG